MTRAALIGLALVTAVAACSSNGKPAATTDASTMDVTADAASDAPADLSSDTEITSADCQQIRLCVAAGGGVDACLARGTPGAQTLFMSLLSCLSAAPCPGLLSDCVCRETCQQDGYCLDQVDACLADSGASADAVCDHYCGG
jgi:hypothetical protein